MNSLSNLERETILAQRFAIRREIKEKQKAKRALAKAKSKVCWVIDWVVGGCGAGAPYQKKTGMRMGGW